MLEDHVAVGHAREVIADGAVEAFSFDSGTGLAADFFGVLHEIREEFFQQFHAALVGLVYLGIEIQIFIKVFAQFEIGFAALGTVLDERVFLEPHLVYAQHTGFVDERTAGFHDVVHLAIDEAADDGVAAAFIGQFAVLGAESGICVVP